MIPLRATGDALHGRELSCTLKNTLIAAGHCFHAEALGLHQCIILYYTRVVLLPSLLMETEGLRWWRYCSPPGASAMSLAGKCSVNVFNTTNQSSNPTRNSSFLLSPTVRSSPRSSHIPRPLPSRPCHLRGSARSPAHAQTLGTTACDTSRLSRFKSFQTAISSHLLPGRPEDRSLNTRAARSDVLMHRGQRFCMPRRALGPGHGLLKAPEAHLTAKLSYPSIYTL